MDSNSPAINKLRDPRNASYLLPLIKDISSEDISLLGQSLYGIYEGSSEGFHNWKSFCERINIDPNSGYHIIDNRFLSINKHYQDLKYLVLKQNEEAYIEHFIKMFHKSIGTHKLTNEYFFIWTFSIMYECIYQCYVENYYIFDGYWKKTTYQGVVSHIKDKLLKIREIAYRHSMTISKLIEIKFENPTKLAEKLFLNTYSTIGNNIWSYSMDHYPYMIGCDNGVIITGPTSKDLQFRSGLPSDMISMTTKINLPCKVSTHRLKHLHQILHKNLMEDYERYLLFLAASLAYDTSKFEARCSIDSENCRKLVKFHCLVLGDYFYYKDSIREADLSRLKMNFGTGCEEYSFCRPLKLYRSIDIYDANRKFVKGFKIGNFSNITSKELKELAPILLYKLFINWLPFYYLISEGKSWNVNTHRYFPKSFKEIIFTCLCLTSLDNHGQPCHPETGWYKLPREILFYIFQILAKETYTFKKLFWEMSLQPDSQKCLSYMTLKTELRN